MSSSILRDYFGRGIEDDIPSAAGLNIPAGTGASYFATDTKILYQLDDAGTDWEVLSSGLEEAPIDGVAYSRQDGIWAPSPTGGAGGWTSPSGSHEYWRIDITACQGGGSAYPRVCELEFRSEPGGIDITFGGTPSASSSYSGFPPSNAFDGNPSTDWLANNVAPQVLTYQFAAPVSVLETFIKAGSSAGDTPADFTVKYSDDGITYTTAWTVTGASGWTTGSTQVFTDPAATYTPPSGGNNSPYAPGVPFLASALTAVGSGSATSLDHAGDRGITWTLTSGSRRGWYKTVPGSGADFRVVVCLNISTSANNQIIFGWYNPSTGDTAHFYLNENGNNNYQFRKEAPFNSYAGQDGGISMNPYSGQDFWFAAEKVGSNFTLLQSNNGVDFWPLWTNPGVMTGVFPAVLVGIEGSTGLKLSIRCWDESGTVRDFPAV